MKLFKVSLCWAMLCACSHYVRYCSAECNFTRHYSAECNFARHYSAEYHSICWVSFWEVLLSWVSFHRIIKFSVVLLNAGNYHWRGRLSTVDLLIKIGSFVKLKKYSFSLKSSWPKPAKTRRSSVLILPFSKDFLLNVIYTRTNTHGLSIYTSMNLFYFQPSSACAPKHFRHPVWHFR